MRADDGGTTAQGRSTPGSGRHRRAGQPMNLVQFKRHDADGDVFINPAHVAMVEPSGAGDGNVTDIVVAAQAGRALVRVQDPIKNIVDKQRRETAGAPRPAGRRRPREPPPPADWRRVSHRGAGLGSDGQRNRDWGRCAPDGSPSAGSVAGVEFCVRSDRVSGPPAGQRSGRAPRANVVQASFRAAIAVPARPHLPFGSAGMFPAGDAPDRDRESLITSSRSTTLELSAAACPPATPHRAHRAARRPAPRPRHLRPARSAPAGYEPR